MLGSRVIEFRRMGVQVADGVERAQSSGLEGMGSGRSSRSRYQLKCRMSKGLRVNCGQTQNPPYRRVLGEKTLSENK
jgi:hypothetical protein